MLIDRKSVDGSLRSIADFTSELPGRLVGANEYPEGSTVDRHLRSEFNVPSYGDFPIVREALVAAMFATLSAVDHVQAWIDLVEAKRATVALATVARGALEGFAKSYFLLSAPSTEVLVARHISITAADLIHPLRHSKFQDHTGKPLDNGSFPKLHSEIASMLDLPDMQRPSVQQMVDKLLSAGAREGFRPSRDIYSQLSGPAHASMSSLGMYRGDGESNLSLPPAIAREQTGYLFAGTCVVAEVWLDVFAAAPHDRLGWVAARSAAELNMIKLINAQ